MTRFPLRRSSRNAGFTLIELLVVIAIIAILAAILFPVFAQAREKARQSSCLSNEKQMGLAIRQYMQDYDETYPLGGYRLWEAFWPSLILSYVNPVASSTTFTNTPAGLGIFLCPDGAQGGQFVTANRPLRGWGIDYASNGNWRNSGGFMAIGPMACINVNPVKQYEMSDAEVKRPADTILISERHSDQAALGGYTYTDPPNKTSTASNWITSVFAKQLYGATGYPDALPNGTIATTVAYPNGPDGAVSARHSGMANFVFCDGHVKSMKPSTTNPDPTNQPQNNMWDATRN